MAAKSTTPSGFTAHPQRLLNSWRRAHFAVATGEPVPSVAAVSAGCNASDVPPIVAAAVCIKPRGLLAEAQVAKEDRPKKTSSDFATMQQLAMRLRGLLKGRDTQTLEKWLSVATNSGIHGMR